MIFRACLAATPKNMITLAFDTSSPQGGVALIKDGQVLSKQTWNRGKSHSEFLTPVIEECLSEAKLSIQSVQRLAVGRGPGSFTGIRIAINAARSLGYALRLPVVGFDSMQVLAAGSARHDLPLIVLLNAQMNLIFAATYKWDASTQTWICDRDIQAVSLETITSWVSTPHLCLGNGYSDYLPFMSEQLNANLVRDPESSDYPLPEILGLLGESAPKDQTLDWNLITPLYIRASGAEEKLRKDQAAN
jgi:tRNA threonylcarbamoyl adenosine modification protein YeaZ